MSRRVWLPLLVAAAVAGCGDRADPAADAGPRFETVVQDDALLRHRPRELQRTIGTLKALGVGRVRINATWSRSHPSPRAGGAPTSTPRTPARTTPGHG